MKKCLTFVVLAVGLVVFLVSFTADEPSTKAELGRLLFFDPILSRDKTISCASCHKPEFAFADTGAVSVGVAGAKGSRNTPSAMNLSLQKVFFWDGRARDLEQQALAPIENPVEMDLPVPEALARLNDNEIYRSAFVKIFNKPPTAETLAEALAVFERTLETTDSRFDRWKFSDDTNAVTDAVKRGFDIFNKKGKCIQCHFGADFTTNEFKNIGLFDAANLIDSGRMVLSGKQEDLGKFKVPGLRNIAITAPYMHNGMFKTLREVIDFYNEPDSVVPNSVNRDTLLSRPPQLSEVEKAELEAFLVSLTDRRFEK